MKIIYTKTIPNMPAPNQDVSRKINFYGFNIDGYEECATIPYQVEYTRNGVDVSNEFEKIFKPMQWRNSDLVYQRDINTRQPLPNPAYQEALGNHEAGPTLPNSDFISEEETPDVSPTIVNPNYVSDQQLAVIGEFLVAPAFDYFLGLFHEHPGLFWQFLDMYIDENYGEGWYGNTSSGAANRK